MLKEKHLFTCLGVCLAIHHPTAVADHPTVAFSSEGAAAINTIAAKPLPAGSWAIGLRTEIIDNDEFSTEQLEAFAANGLEGVHSVSKIVSTSLSASYGLTPDVTLSARLPYINRENIRESELEGGVPDAHTHGDSSGMGDLLLLGQYRVLERLHTDVAILFGVKAPTGQTDEQDDDGQKFETEFQPGSGSWDFLLGASVSKSSGNFGFHANALYKMTTEGSQSTEMGDAISYNAAVTYRLKGDHGSHDHDHSSGSENSGVSWDLSVELNGETRRKTRISGVFDDNSGGTTIYGTLGLRVSSGRFGGFFSYGTPIVQDQNGTQTDADRRIVAGVFLAL